MKNIKLIGICIAILAIYTAGSVWYGYSKGRESVFKEIAAAPLNITIKKDSIALPSTTTTGSTKALRMNSGTRVELPKTTKRITQNIDTLILIVHDLANENRELREEISNLSEPKIIPIESPDLGRLFVKYYPRGDTANWLYISPVRYKYVDSIKVEKTIIQDRPWWELPAAIVGAALAGYGIAHIN